LAQVFEQKNFVYLHITIPMPNESAMTVRYDRLNGCNF